MSTLVRYFTSRTTKYLLGSFFFFAVAAAAAAIYVYTEGELYVRKQEENQTENDC